MEESFLHFIWKHQYFSKTGLKTVGGDQVNIISAGNHNHFQGPDFEGATLQIDGLRWSGFVEIHVKSSDWNQHKHQHDPGYNGVVLHVVWLHDIDVFTQDGHTIPTVELVNRVSRDVIFRYEKLYANPSTIPCHQSLSGVRRVTVVNAIENHAITRMIRKSDEVLETLGNNAGDWERTTFQLLAKSFGFKSNRGPFTVLGQLVPFNLLKRNIANQEFLEVLLYGIAGFLDCKARDSYHKRLINDYRYTRYKYKLSDVVTDLEKWNYGRLRPPNFPTVRIAQLVAVLSNSKTLLTSFLESSTLNSLRNLFKVEPLGYWNTHYRFGEEVMKKSSFPGKSSVDSLIINAVTPTLVAYSRWTGNEKYKNRALKILGQMTPERNAITRRYEEAGINSVSALDTQGLIELFNNSCLKKTCLSCIIGMEILRSPRFDD